MSDQAAATSECAPLLALPAFPDLLGFHGLAGAAVHGDPEGAI
jgi:hypothetical protein